MSAIDIRFDLSNEAALDFIRKYDFAFARRQLIFDVEALRAVLLGAESAGWSLKRIGDEILAATNLDNRVCEMLAQTETIRAANAAALASYLKAGIERVVWIADSRSCQYCRKLSRKAIPIGKPFLESGPFQARKNGRALLIRESVFSPPLHWDCRCAVSADVV